MFFVMDHSNEMERVATSLGHDKVGKCSGQRDQDSEIMEQTKMLDLALITTRIPFECGLSST